jgi:hypothetical protein
MRFAYIDSQGNEVSIPSVDALALRIELGAIRPDTELYDAQADHWGPAQTHEIFHTLSRTAAGDRGFVAPPPPEAPPRSRFEGEAVFLPEEDEEEGAESDAPARPADEEPVFDFSQPLVPVEDAGAEEEDAAEEPEAPAPRAPASPGAFDLDLDLTLAEGMGPGPSQPQTDAPADDEDDGFLDFGGGLELAPEPFEGPAMSFGGEPESTMDFGSGGGFGGGMELEQPMSDFTPEDPPSWMEQNKAPDRAPTEPAGGGVFQDEEPRRVTPPRRALTEDGGEAGRSRPEPRNRPSPPRRTRQRSPTALIMGVLGAVVVGGGGYFGWQAFQGRSATSTAAPVVPALPPVTIPDIPAELLPQMRDLGEEALSGMIDRLQAMQDGLSMPAEPNSDWLAGVYLANATRFPDVRAFWVGIEQYVDQVRDVDTRVFHEQYVMALEDAGMAGDTAAMLLERADSGFLSTREDRFEAYALMDDLVNAALDLHEFLIRNEANIEFDPAAGGISRDPVLEAVPATRELGNEMWGMVDRITGALDALGTLDKVTTERLTAVLHDRIRRAGFR